MSDIEQELLNPSFRGESREDAELKACEFIHVGRAIIDCMLDPENQNMTVGTRQKLDVMKSNVKILEVELCAKNDS